MRPHLANDTPATPRRPQRLAWSLELCQLDLLLPGEFAQCGDALFFVRMLTCVRDDLAAAFAERRKVSRRDGVHWAHCRKSTDIGGTKKTGDCAVGTGHMTTKRPHRSARLKNSIEKDRAPQSL